MTILLAPYLVEIVGGLIVVILTAILFFGYSFIGAFFRLLGNCIQGLYDVGIFIHDTPTQKLFIILFDILGLCARALFWLAVRVFMLLMVVGGVGGVFEVFYGFEVWPMVIASVIGVICIAFNAASDLKKFEEEMPEYSKSI